MTDRKLWTCHRCGWQWFSRNVRPGNCPHCHTSSHQEHANGRTDHDAGECPQCKLSERVEK